MCVHRYTCMCVYTVEQISFCLFLILHLKKNLCLLLFFAVWKKQLFPGKKVANSTLQPPGYMCQTQLVFLLSSIYSSHSAKGSSMDFIIETVCQGSVAIEYQIIFEGTIWWSDRIYRLALSFHLLQIYNYFPRENKSVHCISWTLVGLLC